MSTSSKTVDQLLDECACFDLRRTTRRVAQLYDEAIAPSGLTSPQWSLLRAVGSERMAIAKLSAMLDVDRTSLRRMLDPLERDGLIAVAVDPLDKRARLVGLTPAGRASLKAARACWRSAQERLFGILGEPGWRALTDSLRRTNRAVRAATQQTSEDAV